MMDELQHPGYNLSAACVLYPLLHSMANQGLLIRDDHVVDGKIRNPRLGVKVLNEARGKSAELSNEIRD